MGGDGELSERTKVGDLYSAQNDLSITNEAFDAACRKDPGRTADWFEKLQLALVEEHSCLDELCGN